MKRSKIIFFVLIVILFPNIAFGQVSITISDTTIAANQVHEIPVYLNVQSDDSVFGLRAEFEFDSEHLEYIGIESGNTISDSVLTVANNREGNVLFSLSSIHPLRESGKLIVFLLRPKNQNTSNLINSKLRINEDVETQGTASAIINSITSPVTVLIQGDTTEVRNEVNLEVSLSGLLGRELRDFSFLIDYKNNAFELISFEINEALLGAGYEISSTVVNDSLIQITGVSETPIAQDISIGNVVVFSNEEGAYDIKILESLINGGSIDVNLEFRGTLITQDKTAPGIPQDLQVTFNQAEDSALVELSWSEVPDSDLDKYIISRDDGNQSIQFEADSAGYTDTITKSGNYSYSVQSVDLSGNVSEPSEMVQITITTVSNEILNNSVPHVFTLSQNYPNPFNPSSTIRFGIPEASIVKLEVFNLLGQKVKTLVDGRKSAGFHTVTFDGSDLSSGMYIYRIQGGDFVQIKKMTLVK